MRFPQTFNQFFTNIVRMAIICYLENNDDLNNNIGNVNTKFENHRTNKRIKSNFHFPKS